MTPGVDAVKDIVKANATAVYQDAAQPSVRVLGKALAQCTSLFATPVGRMADIFEKNIHRYIDKLEGLSEEQIVAPDTRILVPILEKLRYTDDEMVADYYAQILATASRPESKKMVAVAFIEILNRLCADELRLLEYINSEANTLILEKETGEKYGTRLKGCLPVVNVHVVQEGGGYVVAIKNLSYALAAVKLDSSQNYNMYLDNMFALGLLIKPAMVRANDNNVYKMIKSDPIIQTIALTDGQSIDYSEARIETTDLGRQLLLVASKNDKS